MDVWEAEAREGKQWNQDLEFRERILALISLVRKKDEALQFYGDLSPWSPNLFMTLGDPGRNDLEETNYSRFTPGKKAREALALTAKVGGACDATEQLK